MALPPHSRRWAGARRVGESRRRGAKTRPLPSCQAAARSIGERLQRVSRDTPPPPNFRRLLPQPLPASTPPPLPPRQTPLRSCLVVHRHTRLPSPHLSRAVDTEDFGGGVAWKQRWSTVRHHPLEIFSGPDLPTVGGRTLMAALMMSASWAWFEARKWCAAGGGRRGRGMYCTTPGDASGREGGLQADSCLMNPDPTATEAAAAADTASTPQFGRPARPIVGSWRWGPPAVVRQSHGATADGCQGGGPGEREKRTGGGGGRAVSRVCSPRNRA